MKLVAQRETIEAAIRRTERQIDKRFTLPGWAVWKDDVRVLDKLRSLTRASKSV